MVKGEKNMMKDPIYKIITELEKYKYDKDDIEMLNDINIIDGMINGIIIYDEDIVNNIRRKYQDELQFLSNLEQTLRSFQINENTSSNKSNEQYLLNTRHALVRVQIMRVLKRKGKEMLEEDLINNDNEYLYNKFVEVMKES